MKKKVLALLLTGALAGTMMAPAGVWAEEAAAEEQLEEAAAESGDAAAESEEGLVSGLLNSLLSEEGTLNNLLEDSGLKGMLEESGLKEELFGESSPLKDLLPEDLDLQALASEIDSQLADQNSQLRQTIDTVKSQIFTEDGDLNLEAIDEMAKQVFGMFSGDSDNAYALEQAAEEVVKEYFLARNAELIESGDVQIFVPYTTKTDIPEEGTFRELGVFTQMNYTKDGANLKLAGETSDIALVTLAAAEDGAYAVQDVVIADSEADLEELCAQMNTTAEDYYGIILFMEFFRLNAITEYLDNNPEVESIEYDGEMLTREQLDELKENFWTDLASVPEEGEEAASDETEEIQADDSADTEAEEAEAVETEAAETVETEAAGTAETEAAETAETEAAETAETEAAETAETEAAA